MTQTQDLTDHRLKTAKYAGWSTPGVTHVDNQLKIVSS